MMFHLEEIVQTWFVCFFKIDMFIFSKPLSLQTYLDIEKYMFVKLYQVHIRYS